MPKTIYNGARGPNPPRHIRQTPAYPSAPDVKTAQASKQAPPQYSGSYVIGLATLHKSNIVPVTNPEQAKEVGNMRRIK